MSEDATRKTDEGITEDVTSDVTEDITQDVTLDEDVAVAADPAATPSPAAETPVIETPAAEAPAAESDGKTAASRLRRAAPERLATDYELKELRKLNADPRLRRRISLWTAFGVLLAVGLSCLYYRTTLTEQTYLWPGAMKNQFNDGSIVFKYRDVDAFQIYYPNSLGMKVERDDEKLSASVSTRIGTYYECPFFITFESYVDTNWWTKTLAQVVDEWQLRMSSERGWGFERHTECVRFFNPKRGAGWPYTEGTCLFNAEGGYYRIGRWVVFRDLDRVFVMLRMVVGRLYPRAIELLESERCLHVSGSLTDRHFEPGIEYRNEPTSWLIRYVRNELTRDFSNANWTDIERAIKTLLVRGYREKDKLLTEDAQRLWASYRNEQQLWYNRRCFSYRCAVDDQDEETLRLIRKEALKKFSGVDDMRRCRILRGDWGK